ncbi:uroporphyrinogen-III C-methyltransferase [Thalassotalea profundi]|uniref:Heme biosynthesis operon protein HemX n=1 Tax=Thalassotalea profundi TaxID=2036687 RepID=A0ABQ3IPA3_9GAMM|nr:uroporphyrinogen-III C-methyltransferase [Thalassotalea profundi]GHE88547.1 heme biosynthesis operon protein HemX [Thalassotalea profundi]
MTDKKTPDSTSSSDKKVSQSTSQSADNTKKGSEAGLSASISLTSPTQNSSNTNTEKSAQSDDLSAKNAQPSKSRTSSVNTKQPIVASSKVPISKIAVLSLLISLAVAGGFTAMHFMHSKELTAEHQNFQQQLVVQQSKIQKQVTQLFEQQANTLSTQVNNEIHQQVTQMDQKVAHSNARIKQLEQQLGRLQQNKSSDWLVHEAQYLLRIASRTLWLEKNTSTAINLLKDADSRLKELNDPQYIVIRQAIRNDIETLQLLPVIDNESILLSLNALGQQVNKLPLAMVKIPESSDKEESLILSENTSDWQENLAKTWRKFLADFITVSRREGNVEPLMSPQYQQNLRENIMLKLQVAQWAVTKRQTQVFQQTLTDVSAWVNEYFDMSQLNSQHFEQSIQELKAQAIDADYPNSLSALSEIRTLLAEKPLTELPNVTEDLESAVNDTQAENTANDSAINNTIIDDDNEIINKSENN